MHKLIRISAVTLPTLILAMTVSLCSQAEKKNLQTSPAWHKEAQCPSHLVNFWSSYARKNANLDSIPAFLISNHCINKNISLKFFTAMKKRFDEPEQKQWTDDLEQALGDTFASI
jgi:hypothetical protein